MRKFQLYILLEPKVWLVTSVHNQTLVLFAAKARSETTLTDTTSRANGCFLRCHPMYWLRLYRLLRPRLMVSLSL